MADILNEGARDGTIDLSELAVCRVKQNLSCLGLNTNVVGNGNLDM